MQLGAKLAQFGFLKEIKHQISLLQMASQVKLLSKLALSSFIVSFSHLVSLYGLGIARLKKPLLRTKRLVLDLTVVRTEKGLSIDFAAKNH